MNVLITGGYGFIGSHVAEEFFKEGYRIFIIDNLSTGNSKNIKFKHTSFQLDIEDHRCEEVFRSNKFDAVIHLAAQINVVGSIEDPYRDTKSNILGLINMLQLSAQYGVRKFAFASSAAVYGNNRQVPLSEEAMTDPLSPYGMSKATGELYCKKWSALYGLSTICFRFSNVYGPRQGVVGEGGVISIFMERAAGGKELEIFGDGNQTRDFIYVKDIANAIYKAVEKDISGIFNLSTNSESSLNELIEILKELQPIKDVLYKDEREGDIKNSCLDNTKIRQVLNWEPRYSLAEGLKSTYKWYMQYYKTSEKDKVKKHSPAVSTPIWKRLSSLIRKSGILFSVENILLFFIVSFMTITTQNASNYYLLDYKLIYIVLVGVMYGTRQAALSSVLSCGLYTYLYVEGGRDIVSLIYDTDSLLQLSFYLLIGIVTGYIIDTKNNGLQDKDEEVKSLNEKIGFMNKVHNETLIIKDELCEQIISTQNSYGKVYDMMTKLNSLNPKEVLRNGIAVLESTMKSDEVAIYILADSKYYVILAAKSEKKDFNVPGIVKIKEREDIHRVIESRDIYINSQWRPSLPVMTAPIIDRGNVIAIACIYCIAFENITLHRENLLRVTANLVSYALTNAYRYKEAAQGKYISHPAAAEAASYQIKENQQ